MKNMIYITLCLYVLLITGCDSSPKIYSYNEVVKDSTDVWTLRKNGKKVNGIVERHTKHFLLDRPCLQQIDIIGGKDVGFKDYIGDECVGYAECTDNTEVWTYYGEQGNNTYMVALKDGVPDGVCKVFDSYGKQIQEIVFEKGEQVKTYEFDSNGDKIIPFEEKLELVSYDTGFYENVNYNINQVLYCPIVIMKFKNISDSPITISDGRIEITAIFLDLNKNEEFSSDYAYLVGISDTPMFPGISRQCHVMSSTGYVSPFGVENSNISCKLYVNGKPFKTVPIAKKIKESNRL